MKLNIFPLIASMIIGVFFTAACDKSEHESPTTKLPDPIRISLKSFEEQIVKSDQTFAFEFFEKVFHEESFSEDKNFMVSPLSLSMALAMTWNGAGGGTRAAMQQTLHMEAYSDDEINSYYKKLKEALLKTDPTTKLSIANAIFTNQSVKINPDFINTNETWYDATIQPVDFSLPSTTGIINQWASDHTNGLIKKVIDSTDPLDLMYLLNAIYFKGIWTTRFDPLLTAKMPFTDEDGFTKQVDMMQQKAEFNYTDDQTLQLVQLPYGNQAFSMMILLPKEGNKLQDVVFASLQSGYWNDLKSKLRKTEVDLFLPKFKTEYSKKLNDVLTNMGMGIAFTDAADFSGMTDLPSRISFVKQDSYISTDESGTEAAAVTTVGMEITSLPQQVLFKADKPFIYLIQENSTGVILFMGAIKNFND